jgi:hypothetical protein
VITHFLGKVQRFKEDIINSPTNTGIVWS